MSITEERYARATRSSHLEVNAEQRGDIDTIIAAGTADSLGVMLCRLRAEFDAIHPTEVAQAADSLTARVLVLMNLRSLRTVTEALIEFSLTQSLRRGVTDPAAAPRAELKALTAKLAEQMEREERFALIAEHAAKCREVADAALAHRERVTAMVGKVVDFWVDRLCHHCDGRGFNGGRGKPQILCSHCKGTRHRRRPQLHKDQDLHGFGLWLLNVMDSKANGAMGKINRKTRSYA